MWGVGGGGGAFCTSESPLRSGKDAPHVSSLKGYELQLVGPCQGFLSTNHLGEPLKTPPPKHSLSASPNNSSWLPFVCPALVTLISLRSVPALASRQHVFHGSPWRGRAPVNHLGSIFVVVSGKDTCFIVCTMQGPPSNANQRHHVDSLSILGFETPRFQLVSVGS